MLTGGQEYEFAMTKKQFQLVVWVEPPDCEYDMMTTQPHWLVPPPPKLQNGFKVQCLDFQE